jgi:branched-chain amino acid transport system substrate-binding protein
VVEVNNGAVALAINGLVAEKNKVFLCSGAGSADLTGPRCSPNMVQWQNDTWMDARIGEPVLRQGGDKWFFIYGDYATTQNLYRDGAAAVEAGGGKVMGAASYPFPATTDFSSYLLQAQASGANVVAFCNAGADTVNCVKQAHEFGLNTKMKLVGVVTFLTTVRALGLPTAQGLLLTESFYWDLNDRTRSFMNRIKPKVPTNWPNSEHAATYGSVTHYLKATAQLGVPRTKASGLEAVQLMKRMPTDDDCYGPGSIRVDGRKMHPLFLFQVKKPEESTSTWDMYKLVDTIPVNRVIRPLDRGGCVLTDKFNPLPG